MNKILKTLQNLIYLPLDIDEVQEYEIYSRQNLIAKSCDYPPAEFRLIFDANDKYLNKGMYLDKNIVKKFEGDSFEDGLYYIFLDNETLYLYMYKKIYQYKYSMNIGVEEENYVKLYTKVPNV